MTNLWSQHTWYIMLFPVNLAWRSSLLCGNVKSPCIIELTCFSSERVHSIGSLHGSGWTTSAWSRVTFNTGSTVVWRRNWLGETANKFCIGGELVDVNGRDGCDSDCTDAICSTWANKFSRKTVPAILSALSDCGSGNNGLPLEIPIDSFTRTLNRYRQA
jgi:hypothetical protein